MGIFFLSALLQPRTKHNKITSILLNIRFCQMLIERFRFNQCMKLLGPMDFKDTFSLSVESYESHFAPEIALGSFCSNLCA